MSSRRIRFALPVAIVLGLGIASFAFAATHNHGNGRGHDHGSVFTASLNGHNETPAVHTMGTGNLTLTINSDNTISYTLTYSGLNSAATMAHIHFGQPNVAGGVVIWFCGPAAPAKQTCPAGTGSATATVTGTVAAADVQELTAQGIKAGDLAAVLEEIHDGFGYANVHTQTSPLGEIRGQLSSHGHDHGDNDDH
jgi:hypothetical protein